LKGRHSARFEGDLKRRFPILEGVRIMESGIENRRRNGNERDMTSLLAMAGDLSSDGNMRLRIYPSETFTVGLDDCVLSVPSFHEMHVIVLASNNAQHRRCPDYIR